MKNERYDELADKLETAIETQVEYECEHEDAGNNYSHLFREGDWSYHNGLERFTEWLLEFHNLTIPEDQLEHLEDELLDWCTMESGHIFSGGTDKSQFVVGSFAVGEVESQFDFPMLLEILECTEDECQGFIILALEDNRFYLCKDGDGVLSYSNTNAVWQGVVNIDWVKDRLED